MAKRAFLKVGEALMLRTCDADGKSYNGFQWPESGPVSCPDWKPEAQCGNGLHGLLWGVGDGSLLSWLPDAKWLVVRVSLAEVVKIDELKVKVPRGEVVYYGDRLGATGLIAQYAAAGCAIVGGTATAGDEGTATAGYRGTATAGDRGTATAGDEGTATAGYRGTATAGYRGTATAGDRGTATAGDRGTATAGDRGTATAGYRGTATAGDEGSICIRYWNGQRYKMACFDVGENGIKPNVKYRVNEKGEPQEVSRG